MLLLAATAVAQERCPWIGAATVAGFVGTPVTVRSTEDRCEFRWSPEGRAVVEVRARREFERLKARCRGRGEGIRGVGNEAIVCEAGSGEIVVGRVREKVFSVWLSERGHEAREKVSEMAEQVAGSLF